MVEKIVIPAKAGIQDVRDLHDLDSGSPLRSARNDGDSGLSQCHSVLNPLFRGPDAAQWNPGNPLAAPDVLHPCGRAVILPGAE
jgi:hypothetical protein